MAKTLGPDFVQFDPNVGPKFFFHWFYLCLYLDIVTSYHCMQFQVKLMNQTWENGKKPSFGTNFSPFGPNLGPIFFSVDFTSTACYILLQSIIVCNFKEN